MENVTVARFGIPPCVGDPFFPFFRQKVTSLQLKETEQSQGKNPEYMWLCRTPNIPTPRVNLLCTPHVSSHTISSIF